MERREFLKNLLILPASVVAFDTLNNIKTLGIGFSADVAEARETNIIKGNLQTLHENPKGKNIEPFWLQPRRLHLSRPSSNEYFNEVYWENGKLNLDGYTKLCWLLRDVTYKEAVWIDPRVLDILLAIQAWVSAYGYNKPIQINSGYRTVKHNSKLEGAAKNSEHIKGKAIDFVVPDLPTKYISALAAHYRGGGVGFYPNKKFTHIDSGKIRTWVGK